MKNLAFKSFLVGKKRRLLSIKLVLIIFIACIVRVSAAEGNLANWNEQERTVTGTVTDRLEEPLPGVTIMVEGTNIGTVTNSDGEYSLTSVPSDAILVFSFIGMVKQEIAVEDRTEINIVMEQETIGIEEVVAVGYGEMRRGELTGSVTQVKPQELSNMPVSSLSNTLAGRLSGVYVAQSTGVPGASSSIRIRSSSSWNYSPPIFVIDGVVRDKGAFDMLDPNEVENISILKDAASTAIYGSRSSGGVVLVTTRSGQVGKPSISYSTNYSVESPTSRPETLDAYTSGVLNNRFWQLHTGTNWFGDSELEELRRTGGYNYLDELYRNPASKNHSLSASGGTESIKYYLGGSFFDQTGFLPNLDYSRYNLRANIDASVNDNLSVGLNMSTNYGEQDRFNSGSHDLWDFYGKLDHFFFYVPGRIDGNIVNPGWIGSMIGLIEEGGYDRNSTERIDAQLSVNYKIPFIEGLSAQAVYSQNNANHYRKRYFVQTTQYNYKRIGETGRIWTDELESITKTPYPGQETLLNSNSRSRSYQFNAKLFYNRNFDRHNIDAIAVFEEYDYSGADNSITRQHFPIITKDQFFATSTNRQDSWGGGGENYSGRKSYIGRVNYHYDGKYLLSASLRADGSMLFAPDKRWGYFPSVSAGWILSEENFLRDRLNIITNLKIRGSLGYTGNDAVGGWQWQEAYYPSGGFYFGNSVQPAIRHGGIVNEDLTWEKSRSINLGLDVFTDLNFGMILDYWNRHTYDILGARILSLPTSFGGTMPSENYGIVDSRGFEIELNYRNNIGDFGYDIRGNFSYATTEVVLRDVAEGALDVDNPIGKPLGYIATYVSTGIIRTQEELDALPDDYLIFGAQPALGHLNYKDLSGPDGEPDGRIDHYDRQIISDFGSPPYSAGLNLDLSWRGLSLNVFLQSLFGHQKLYDDNWSRGFPLDARPYAWWGDSWSEDNINAQYPAMQAPGQPPSIWPSSFWYEDAGFVRLKNLSIGYNLPSRWLGQAKIQQARLYITGTNLFYLSPFKHYDPEIRGHASYPNMKTWSTGINITL